jgi:hypothetical protein
MLKPRLIFMLNLCFILLTFNILNIKFLVLYILNEYFGILHQRFLTSYFIMSIKVEKL